MRWPWHKRGAVTNTDESQRALAHQQRERAKAVARETEVDSVSDALARHYTENHVGELLEKAMRGRKG